MHIGSSIAINNNPTSVIGGFSNTYSMSFDGVDEKVNLGRITASESTANFSVSFWIKRLNTNPEGKVFFGHDYYTLTDGFSIGYSSSNRIVFSVSDGSNAYIFSRAVHALDSGWNHIICVYDGGLTGNTNRLKMYKNGVLLNPDGSAGTVPALTDSTTADVFIGGGISVFGWDRIDEMAYYDVSLAQSDVDEIYNNGKTIDLSTITNPPIHWWRMGDGSDTISTINDVGTTGGVDGTPTNMESGDFTTDVP